MDSTSFQLTKILSPFQRSQRTVSQRLYCDESLTRIVQDLAIDEHVVVLNGVVVEPSSWDTTIPRIGDEVIFVPVILGGDDDKGILQIAGIIALSLIAPGAGLALTAPLGLSTTATFIGAKVVAAAIVYGGSMAINSLMPTPDGDDRNFAQDNSASQNFTWNPHTTHREGLVSPRAYGRNKLYGNIRSTWTEIALGQERQPTGQTIKILLGLCQGPVKGIVANTVKINDQDVGANFPDVTLEERFGTSSQSVISFMDDTKHEVPVHRRFTLGGGAITYTTPNKNFDKLEIELIFPRGLYTIVANGGLGRFTITVKIEISEAGAGVWSTLAETDVFNNVAAPVRYLFDSTVLYDGGAAVTITPGTQYDIRVTRTAGTDDEDRTGSDSYLGLVREVITDNFIYPMRALLAFQGIATDRLSGTVKLSCVHDGAIVPKYQNNNFAVVNISQAAAAVVTAAAGHGIVSGDYILFTGVNGMTDINNKVGRVTGTTATTIATNIDSSGFSAFSSGGTGWEYDLNWTDDPGAIIFDILTDPVIIGDGGVTPYEVDRFRGYPPSKINKVALYAVTAHAATLVDDGRKGTEKRVRFNGIFDAATDRWSAMLKVCQVARCIPVWNGVEIDFALDKASNPVQKFNVANIDVNTFEESYLEQVGLGSEFEIHYLDEDMDYRREILPVVDPDITSTSSRMTLNLMGLTKQSEVWRAAKLRLAKNRLLKSTISFTADIDAVDCTIGDNIYVQHDVPDQWGAGGRVVSATTADIITEKDLTYESGSTYKLIVRHSDDTLSSKTVLNIYNPIVGVTSSTFVITGNYTSTYKTGDKITVIDSTGNDGIYTLSTGAVFGGVNSTLTVDELVVHSTVDGGLYNNRRVVVTANFATAPEAGDLWTFGEQDVNIYTVLELSRDVDQRVRLSCIEYNASIYDPDDEEPLITKDQGITAPESVPWSTIPVSLSDIVQRYPALATIGPPVSDQPLFTDINFTDNIPNMRVDWTSGVIAYKGTIYSITAGNSGTAKYVFWDVADNPTTLQSSNTQSDGVGDGRFIRCVNNSGIAHVIGEGNLYWGEMLVVETLSALSAQLGDVLAGTLTGTTITGGLIRTATSGKRVEMDSTGIKLKHAGTAGLYGTAGNGGSDIVYGASSAKAITAITKAANAKISATGHGFSVGNKVRIIDVEGMTEINYDTAGMATITDADPDLDGDAFEVDINSTGFGVYTTAGTATVGSGQVYGTGVLATINHADRNVPFRVESEQIYGDFHGPNRTSEPTGKAGEGDEALVNGQKYVCTTAGTPGTWEPVTRFIDRGDPIAVDYDKNDFTTDGTWNDWDISGEVGVGKRLVKMFVQITDDATNSVFAVRENGNSNDKNIDVARTQVVNVPADRTLTVMTDSSGVIEYFGTNVAFTGIDVTIKGWWVL